MMLTIHGLPVSIKYLDLKTLIKKECNIGDFILDNLVNEAGGSKKVRIGVADEAEGARLTKCLNGYRMGSSLLRVVPVGKAAATLTPSNFNQQGVFAPRNAISNQQGYVVQPVTLMGNQQGLWNTGTPSNQWSSNQTQSQNFNFQQGSTSSFSTQPSGPSNQRPPVQRDVYTFNRSMPEQVFGFAAKSTATPAPGSSQITGHGNLSYPIQGQGQPSTWNQTMQQQKPLPFEKHNHSQLGNASNKFASVDKRPGMPLLERPTAQSRIISPPGRRVSPSWRRNSPSGRRASPSRWVALQGVGGSHREIGGPPHASLSDRRISPGRGVSPNDRRMARQPNRRDSPGRRLVSPPRRESPTRHMRYSPSRRLTSNPNFDSEGRSFKQVRPAYEPDPKGPNQAMYSSDYRPAAHESVSYPVQGREKNQRNSPWQQERDKSIFAAQMKKDDDRRDARNPVSRGPEPMVEGKRSSPSPKSRSPIRREIRDRSPVRDRYKRHSPSPRSPRRSWALEKRRSPNMQDAPPPPIWPGPNVEDHYARPGRPNFSERIEKADTVKHIQDWDRRTYDGQAEEGRHEHRMEDNRPYEDINRMRRGIGARDASARREPSPRHGFKAIEPRFSPQDNKQSKFGLRDTKLQPRDREFDPREQKFDPRDSKLDARDSKQDMRDSKQDLRDVKIGARVPTFGARNAEYDARNSKFEHREHNFQIREPKFEHRESKFEPREQKYESRGGEREKYEPRETKYDPRDGCEPKFEPSDPKILRDTKYDSRDPKFEARDDYKDRRDVRRPEFSEREDYRSSQRHGDREEPFRRVDNSREDFKLEDRKDYRKRNDEIDKDFEDIYKRSMEFKQKVEENLRKPDRKQDFREDRQEDDDRRKAYDERERSHNYRDEEMRAYRHNVERDLREDRSRFRHPGDIEKRDVWNVQVKPGIRAMMPHAVKSKRDKAAEEICNKMIHKYGDDNMSEDLKLRVEEELKLLISRILYDMFGDRDVSFIELVVKFNSKHDTRGELKIFQEVMAGFSSHGRMKRPAPDSSAIPAKTSRKSPHPDLKEGVKTRGETYISGWDFQPTFVPVMAPHFDNVPQMIVSPLMVPSQFVNQDRYHGDLRQPVGYPKAVVSVAEGFNLYLCKDNFKPFTDMEADILKQFIVHKIVIETETSQGWAPNFTLKGLQSMFRYELHTCDVRSRDWLIGLDFTDFKLFNLLVYNKEELWYERAAIWLPGHSRCRNIEPLDKLKLQNRKLESVNIGKWKLVKKIINTKGTRVYVDMPPSSARALEVHKMTLSYELQKVNVFLKAVAVDKDAFEAGLMETSVEDQSQILAAAKSSPMPALKDEPKIVKITLKGSKSLAIDQARKIKEMIIYHLFKYHQQEGMIRTDFIKYGFISPNAFGILPENDESKRWLMSLDIGKLNRHPIVVLDREKANTRYLHMIMSVPSGRNMTPAGVFERLKLSNQGLKGIHFNLWKPMILITDRHNRAKYAVEVDLESAETIYKMIFQLDYLDDRQRNCMADFRPDKTSESDFFELIQKYKAELTDSYDVANMDIASESDEHEDIVCMCEIND